MYVVCHLLLGCAPVKHQADIATKPMLITALFSTQGSPEAL